MINSYKTIRNSFYNVLNTVSVETNPFLRIVYTRSSENLIRFFHLQVTVSTELDWFRSPQSVLALWFLLHSIVSHRSSAELRKERENTNRQPGLPVHCHSVWVWRSQNSWFRSLLQSTLLLSLNTLWPCHGISIFSVESWSVSYLSMLILDYKESGSLQTSEPTYEFNDLTVEF